MLSVVGGTGITVDPHLYELKPQNRRQFYAHPCVPSAAARDHSSPPSIISFKQFCIYFILKKIHHLCFAWVLIINDSKYSSQTYKCEM